ncbi:lipopolysaccharide biosynthesis protein [Aureliella helgolandensis]|uniref:Polysaccharide biosynthesis protein n=1 Tax=Aureliella helgolandensis TaxID=2527968 RepID=A0A518GDY8_9BACT|nr:oligosaccharide flippase family protein [Aureliella helgolandensis]QDV26812.1 Polysaccharide biosynthesis protein [Aureliella helgolandensis]
MSPLTQVLRNIFFGWAGYAAQIVITLLLTPLVLEKLGETQYGLWTLLISITGYYGLIDIGFRPGLIQYLSRSIGERDDTALMRVASSGFFSLLGIGIVILVVTCAVAYWLPSFVNLTDTSARDVAICALFLGIGVAVQFPFLVFSSTLSAAERFDVANIIGIVSRIAYAALAYSALSFGGGILSLAIAMTVTNVADYVARAVFAKRYVPALAIRRKYIDRQTIKNFLGFGTWTSLGNASERIASYSDMVIIGGMLSAAAIAPYALATSMISHFNRVVWPVATVLFPAATKLDARGNISQLQTIYLTATRLILGLALALAVVASYYAHPFFHIWLKNSATAETIRVASHLITFLTIPAVAVCWQMVGRQIMLARRHHQLLAMLLLPESVLNLILSLSLVQYLGVWGVALGTVISTSIFHLIVHPYFVARAISLPASRIVRETAVRPILLATATCIAFWSQAILIPPPVTWLELFAQATCSVMFVTVLFVLIVLYGSERKIFYPRLFRLLQLRPNL